MVVLLKASDVVSNEPGKQKWVNLCNCQRSQQETDGTSRRMHGRFIYKGSIRKGVGIGEAKGRGRGNCWLISYGSVCRAESRMDKDGERLGRGNGKSDPSVLIQSRSYAQANII